MSRKTLSFLMFCLVFLNTGTLLAWSDLEGGDHGNTPWTPANGTYIAGRHYGISSFSVPSGTTVYVKSHAAGYGWLSIHAQTIDIQGTIDGNYAGYPGGVAGRGGEAARYGGNPGGESEAQVYGYNYKGKHGLPGGSGNFSGADSCDHTYYGCGGGGGGPGGGGGYRENGCTSSITGWPAYSYQCTGGAGGGAGGGGYALPDVTFGNAWVPYGVIPSKEASPLSGFVYKGTGGGGGGGPGASGYTAYTSAHNESGGAGGGAIMLWASNALSMSGTITSKGANGGNGAAGGSGYYPGCSECGCNWLGFSCEEKCLYYYYGGSSIGGGGGAGGGVSIGAGSSLSVSGTVNISGGTGGYYSGALPYRYAGKGSGGVVKLHADSPSCSGSCTSVGSGSSTCSGSVVTAEVWDDSKRATPAPGYVRFTAEDTPADYLDIKVKIDGVEYTTSGEEGFVVRMAYGQIYQIDIALYQSNADGNFKYVDMKMPDNRKVTGTSLSVLYNGGEKFRLYFKNLDSLYWSGLSSSLVGSRPQCVVGNNLWSNPCNWIDGEGNVPATPPTATDDIMFTNCAIWPVGFEPRIDANAYAQSLMVDEGCEVYWAATGGELNITTTLQISGGEFYSAESGSRLVVGSGLYLSDSAGVRGKLLFDNVDLYISGDIFLGTNTDFSGETNAELILQGGDSTIISETDLFVVDHLTVAKDSGAELTVMNDIGKTAAGGSSNIKTMDISGGTINLTDNKIGVEYSLVMSNDSEIIGDNILSSVIVRGHSAAATPITLRDTAAISLKNGSILLQPDIDSGGTPIEVPVAGGTKGIQLLGNSSITLDNALISMSNNLDDSGWDMEVAGSAVLSLSNSSYVNVDRALTITSPNVEIYSSTITTGYEAVGRGTMTISASSIKIDYPSPWNAVSSKLRAFGNLNFSSTINGQGPEFYVDGTAAARSATISTTQPLYKLFVDGGQISFSGDLTVQKQLQIELGGELMVSAGNRVVMGDAGSIVVNGKFSSTGSVSNYAVVTSDASNHYYSFEAVKGEINSTLTVFERLDSHGLQIKSDATINATSALNRCTFRNSNESAPFAMMTVSNSQNITCNQVTFEYSSGTPDPDQFNVFKVNNQGSITFTNEAGSISGEAYDDDYYNRINWTLGNPTLSYYDVKDTALNSDLAHIQLSIILTGQPENTQYLIQNMSSVGPEANLYLKTDGTFTSDANLAWASYLDFGGPTGITINAQDSTVYRFRVKARATIGGIPQTPVATWDESQPAITTIDRTAPSTPGIIDITEQSDSGGKYLSLSWAVVGGSDYVVPMREKDGSGEYWPVNGFFDGFTDFNYTKDPQWAVSGSGVWETSSQLLTLESGYTSGAIYFQGYTPGPNYLYHLKAMKVSGSNGVNIPFLYRGVYPCWKIGQNVSGVMTSFVQGTSAATSREFNMNASLWYDIKILVLGDNAFGYIDNKLMWSASASDPAPTNGPYIFMGLALDNTAAYFDNVSLKPLVANSRGSLNDLNARDFKAPTAPAFGLSNVTAASFKTIRISWDAITDQGSSYKFHLDAIDALGNYSSGTDNTATVTEGFGDVTARARVNDDQPDIDANYDNGLATSTGTFADMNIAGVKPGNAFRAVRIKVCDAKAADRNCTDWLGRAACAGSTDCTGYIGALSCSSLLCDYNTRPPGIPRYTLAVIPGNDASNTYPLGVAPTAIVKTGTDLDEDSIWVQFDEGANTAGTQFAVAWHSAPQSGDCANAQSYQGWLSTTYNPAYGYGSSTTESWFAGSYWEFDDDATGSTGLNPSLFYCFAVKARNGEGIETALTPWSTPVKPPYKPRVQAPYVVFSKGQEALNKPMLKVNGNEDNMAASDIQTATIVIEDKSGAADISSVLVRVSYKAAQDPLWTGGRGYFEWNRDTGVFQERLNNQNLGGNRYVAVYPTMCNTIEAGNLFTITFAWTALASNDWYGDQQANGISILIQDSSGITTSWTENQYGDVEAEAALTFHVSSQPGEPQPNTPAANTWTNDRTPTLKLAGAKDPNQTGDNYVDNGDTVSYKFRLVDKPYCDGSNGTATVAESAYIGTIEEGSALTATWETVAGPSGLAAGRYYWCGTAKDQHDYSSDAGIQPWERTSGTARMIGIDYTAPTIPSLTAYNDNPADGGTSMAEAPAWVFDRTIYFQWAEQQPQSSEPPAPENRAPFVKYYYKLTNHFEGITAADIYPYPGGTETTELFADYTTGEGIGYGIKHFCVVGQDAAGNVTGFNTKSARCVQIQIDFDTIEAPVLTSATHSDEAVVYCTDTTIDGSSVIPNTIPNAYQPEFTIADPPTYSGIYGYSFSVFDSAGRIPDKCQSNCDTWTGFEDTLDPLLPSDGKCNNNTLICTDSNTAAGSGYNVTYAPASASVTDLQHSWKYNLDIGGTYYVSVVAYTLAGKWSDFDQYRYNVCACEGNDCKDYENRQARIATMVDFSGGRIYAPGSASSIARRGANAQLVDVAPFSIDATEVSNEQYLACVADGACDEPEEDGYASRTRNDYLFNEKYKDYPVLNVTWDMAQQYCAWQGKRLPSEVEWEFAAQNSYAGLDTIGLTRKYSNDLYSLGDTAPVFENHGPALSCRNNLYNMFNNVSEWVSDWYAPYDAIDYSINPYGPEGMETCQDACLAEVTDIISAPGKAASGVRTRRDCYAECYRKVVRGGSFEYENVSGSIRDAYSPDSYGDSIGFRCAMDAVDDSNSLIGNRPDIANMTRQNLQMLSSGATAQRR